MISLYLAQTGWLHRWPAGLKLLVLALASIGLYFVSIAHWVLFALLGVLSLYASLGRPALRQLRLLRPLLLLFALMFLVQWWSVGLEAGLTLVLRMCTLILLANLVTLTTRMDAMMDAISPLLAPLRLIRVEPARIAFAVALVIRFVPVLLSQLHSLREAWNARGGGRQLWRLAIPMTLQAIRLSDHVAEGLAARGGIRPRTDNRRQAPERPATQTSNLQQGDNT
ncbi:MAG: energy-coupling factor transporter transmembrane protein EcfT [Natronospirillum sp.]|uniref:energy-coupling factor transporter transmembrane component T family protein n=1 Tax=Natronospirillum sp. TaxID=2812955 RepID=UPI0025FBDC4C|nr:energy-coupling factor transporter transmembrane component T [Natronospirillum sp.]MCH8550773.1 energy-coupling factor transporter transmembrane protein EcfT [Natronospirillum sp.]